MFPVTASTISPATSECLPAAEFPHHVRFAPELARFTTDERFEFGVRTFLAGLQGRFQAGSGSARTPGVPPK